MGARAALIRIAMVASSLLSLLSVRASAQPTPLDPGFTTTPSIDAAREDQTSGAFDQRAIGLSPCRHTARIAFSAERPATAVWSGRFTVLREGRGVWDLVIFDAHGVERWRRRVDASDVKAPQPLDPGLIPGPRVRIQLQGPGAADSICPRIRLNEELQIFGVAKPRGQFGDRDNRVMESDAAFLALPDAATIRQWAPGVAHLLALSPGRRLLPCTGFFLGHNVLVTAAHCIRSSRETPGSIVFVAGQPLTGPALKHLITDLNLDFTVIWVDTPTAPATLSIGSTTDPALVLWQFHMQPGPHVSVEQCAVAALAAARLSHKCDSSVGTSGAPIQSRATGAVVAMHVDGCAQFNATTSCINNAVRIEGVQQRIRDLANLLHAHHPKEAPQLLAAFGVVP